MYATEEIRVGHKKAARKRYGESEKGRASKRQYRQSELGKAAQKQGQKKYQQSEHGRAVIKEYQQSEKFKAGQEKYRATIPGHLRCTFQGMRYRCYNPKSSNYKYYGGRGVRIFWKTSDEFIDYVVNVLQQDPRGLTIDRIDSDDHYRPGNIWFCTAVQNRSYRGKDHFQGMNMRAWAYEN